MTTTLSIVIPVFNEKLNLPGLYHQIKAALPRPVEIIFVDDGSTDGSIKIIQSLAAVDKNVRYIQLRRNFGKTAALAAGFEAARGEAIATMDADLQDDPAHLPDLLKKLISDDYGLVSGWRVNRSMNDPLDKVLPSLLYNWVVRNLTGVPLHDFNCGFKVYRREALAGLRLYGELHRFMPVLVAWNGFKVAEAPVYQRPRLYGKSKFGHGRLVRGLLDFIMVLFLTRYLSNPMRLFGLAGVVSLGVGGLITLYLAGLWLAGVLGLAEVGAIGPRPLLAAGIFSLLFGAQFMAIGLLGEMIRYFGFQPEQEYSVKDSNLAPPMSQFFRNYYNSKVGAK